MHGHPHHLHGHARVHAFSHADACCCGEPTPHHHASVCCCFGPDRHGSSACCGTDLGTGFHRRFTGREEKVVKLEAYLADLQAEAKAVQEKLNELRRAA